MIDDETQDETPRLPREPRDPERKKKGWPRRLTQEDREVRQGLILAKKVAGEYAANIARAFEISVPQAYKELQAAQQRVLHKKAVAFITYELMPKALAVYSTALDQGDKEVATRVLEGLGILTRGNGPGMVQVNLGGEDATVETFEAWRMKVSRAQAGEKVEEAPAVTVEAVAVQDEAATPQEESNAGSDATV